jgi:hypothetical protein
VDPRLRTALRLYTFGVLGLFLLVTPWTPVWQRATTALLPTALCGWVQSGWFRGVVSAVGALDLVIALQSAVELWERLRVR